MARLVLEGDKETLQYIKDEIEDLYCDNEDEQDPDVLLLNKICMMVKIEGE